MADTKISADPTATDLTSAVFPIVQGGTNKKAPADLVMQGSTGATDNRLLRADGAGGHTVQNSEVAVDDSGAMSGLTFLTAAATAKFSPQIVVNAEYAGTTAGYVNFQKGRSSGPVQNGDTIGTFVGQARDSASALRTSAYFSFDVSAAPAAGSVDGKVSFYTTQSAATALRLTIQSGLLVGAATGGDKGVGTVNATAVYDDNTLLTCYVFDAALDGDIIPSKWDAKVPDRTIEAVYEDREIDTGEMDGSGQAITRRERHLVAKAKTEKRRHDDMRKFRARLGTDTDPLDLDKYIAHWRTKRHLTSMPNEATFDPVKGLPSGAWIQRLVETVEIQAIHIAQLHERLKALEAGPLAD